MVPFAGWEMPLYFPGGILEEHRAVREGAGLFDVSHMARFHIGGEGALGFVDKVITNNAARLDPDQLLYTCVCNAEGGVLDDVTVYRRDPGFLMVVNAVNGERIGHWLADHAAGDVRIHDQTDEVAQLALQGPGAPRVLASFVGEDVAEELGYYRYRLCAWNDTKMLVSRNGYTGEDGFEIYLPAAHAVSLATSLLSAGEDVGLRPVGLGARDTLRTEMAYCLYGHELDTETTPLEAGLDWTVKLGKGEFIGREVLLRQKKEGVRKKLVGLMLSGRNLPRHGDQLLHDGRTAGNVTSGGISPTLGVPIALGYVEPSLAELDTALDVQGRRGPLAATVVSRPFYRQGSVRIPKKPAKNSPGDSRKSPEASGMSKGKE
jgi:aminomethyltransferase